MVTPPGREDILRRVVDGMGIASIGNDNGCGSDQPARRSPASSGPTTMAMNLSPGPRRPQIDFRHRPGRPSRYMRFHGGGTAWNHVAMDQAIADSGLTKEDVSNERTGIVMAQVLTRVIVDAAAITRDRSEAIGPFAVPKAMSPTALATLATWFEIKGVNYSISRPPTTASATPTSWIQWGKQDVMFAGGCEDHDCRCLTSTPRARCPRSSTTRPPPRPAPTTRTVTVFNTAGGAGVLVLEELEHAKARGAAIYAAEIAGYGATSDGWRHGRPSGEGAIR